MFRARLFTTLISIGLLSWVVVARFSFIAFLAIAIIGLLAQWEFYRLQEARGMDVFTKFGLLVGGIYFLLFSMQMIAGDQPEAWAAIESSAIVVVLLIVLGRSVFDMRPKSPVATVALTLFGFFYVPYLFNYLSKAMYLVAPTPEVGLVLALYVVAVTKATDIGAYVSGKWLGRHAMTPRISPGKTWEGFVGGILLGLGMSLALVLIFPTSLEMLRWSHAWVLGLLLPLISVMGDLVESRIKRDANQKDSSGVIPGLGGTLDMIDSLLFTAPACYLYFTLIQLA